MADNRATTDRALHRQMMDGLKQRLGRIAAVMPPAQPVVYLDYPVHDNVGDLLIHQGADAFLADNGYTVLGRFSMHDFSHLDRNGENKVVLKPSIRMLDALAERDGCVFALHGGGNFGDLWPQFQMFRELIVERYPDTRIVVLPQSIHFDNPAKRERSARVLRAHKKLFVFVRDEESLAFLRAASVAGAVVPDMAHQLWGRQPFDGHAGGSGTLVMRRRDRESRNAGDAGGDFDWAEMNGEVSRLLLRGLRKWQTIDNPLRRWIPNYQLWRIYRDHLVRRAVERFRPYGRIDTDRLHGVILAALLSKQVRYGEGSYGKLHRYAHLWLAGSKLIESERPQQAAE